MERPSESRNGEQHPLLKVDNGAGDVATHQPSSPTVCREFKKMLLDRWPEVMTAYWMTLSLLGSAFLICFVLGTNGYRRTPLLMKNNVSKLAGDVYYHHIIQRGEYLPFVFYSQFLSTMAEEYQSLRFNIIILVDDSVRAPYHISRNSICFNGWVGYQSRDIVDENNKREMMEFERRHPNVNITLMCLSKYMAITPIRCKWRNMPLSYLRFYARIFAVWQYGGIGIDLTAFNNQFSNKLHFDRRINEILKNHNNGIVETDYNTLLSPIDKEDETLLSISNQIFNETIRIFNNLFSFPALSATDSSPMDIPVIRTHRARRQVDDDIKNLTKNFTTGRDSLSDLKPNVTENYKETVDLDLNVSNFGQVNTAEPVSTLEQLKNTTAQEITNLKVIQEPYSNNWTAGMNQTDTTDSEPRQILLVYDFSLMTDTLGPAKLPIVSSAVELSSNSSKNKIKSGAHLALHSNGIFVAATEKKHPFLGMMLTAGFIRTRPDLAIQDTIFTHCSGVYRYESYCNIYGL